ncbi:MAG: M14 family zinc carboxypeptidase [Flavobacteriaceae bacterium]|jgi:hypothetical protein
MLTLNNIYSIYDEFKVHQIKGRYITNSHILPFLKNLNSNFKLQKIGFSEKNTPIYSVNFGNGPINILIWSQMHGNEATTTKSLIDCLNLFNSINNEFITNNLCVKIIPILNPDGANNYCRLNSNNIDLNRDAQELTQSESRVLRDLFDEFKPHYCFNMHDQRTIYSAGDDYYPATLSFLSPSQDNNRSLTINRKIGMKIISNLRHVIDPYIPNQISRYDDKFNINCVGDKFQSLGVPTILFEAGHYDNDYNRDITRKYMMFAIYQTFLSIINKSYINYSTNNYFDIPENKPTYFDVLIKGVSFDKNLKDIRDVGILYSESLEKSNINFTPFVAKIGDLSSYYGHKIFYAKSKHVTNVFEKTIRESDLVNQIFINNNKIDLFLINNLT